MLDEASIITAMRRPGKLTCSCVSDEYGSASAMTKNGTPTRNSSSAPWRTSAVNLEPPLQSSTAGSATCVRPAFVRAQRPQDEHRRAQPDQHHRRDDRVVAMGEQQIGGARVPPLDHHLPDDGRNLGYRDHARLSSALPARQAASRFMIQNCSSFTRLSTCLAVASDSSRAASSSAPSRPKCAVVKVVSARASDSSSSVRLAFAVPPRELASDGQRRHGAGDRDRVCRAAIPLSESAGRPPGRPRPSADSLFAGSRLTGRPSM